MGNVFCGLLKTLKWISKIDSPTKKKHDVFGFCSCWTLNFTKQTLEEGSSINLLWGTAVIDDEFEMNGLSAKSEWQNK